MSDIIVLMLLVAVLPITVLGTALLLASTYYNYIQKRKQRQAQQHTLLGVVMPKQNKGEPNA